MRKFLGNYKPIYAPKFQRQIRGLAQEMRDAIEERIDTLIDDPWHNTRFLKGQYRGKRRMWLNRVDRLVFVICEECRELDHIIYNQCSDCDTTPENALVIGFIIFEHKY